jgi:protein-disulfide isomerase
MNTDTAPPRRRAQLRSILDLSATILIIVACCIFIWAHWPTTPPTPPLPTHPLSLEGAATRGNIGARVALIEYSDFQCPFCGDFARSALPELEQRYVNSGQVLLAFRHLPLEKLHPFAFKAAEAAECSRRQGKFWEMHDRSFEKQQLDEASLGQSAQTLGLDMARFNACLAGEATDQVRKDMAGAKDLAVSATPTFFLGTVQPDGQVKVVKRLSGSAAKSDLERSLNALVEPYPSNIALASGAVLAAGAACLAGWTIRRYRRLELRK